MIGILLAFIAGYVDTVGFVALFGLFTAHVTGNFVLIGASVVEPRPGVLVKLLALPTFVLVVGAARLWTRRQERRQRDSRAALLVAQILLLAGFLAAGLVATPIADPDAELALLTGLLGVAAMAVQNAGGRLAFAEQAPTTVMTGNVTQAVIDAVDLLAGHAPPAVRARFAKMAPAIVAFALGACSGGLAVARLGFPCLAVPILALVAVLVLIRRD